MAQTVKTLYANQSQCIGCRACEVACEREHDGSSNVYVTRIEGRGAMPVSCRHCLDSPCEGACPRGALASDAEGIMVLNRDKCNSCGLCIFACPFGAIHVRQGGGITKCDLCAHRRERDAKPACATTCPMGAIIFEDCDMLSKRSRQHRASEMAWEILKGN